MYLASYRLQSRIAGANRCWIFYLSITELPLLCEERYKDILERAYAPLTYTPLPIIPKLERLFGDLTEYFREQPNTCSRYLDVKCQEIIYILTCYYPIQQVSTFFYPISTYTESFHYFVMQNYDKVKNVEEFAHLADIPQPLSADYSRICMAYLYTNGFWTKNARAF